MAASLVNSPLILSYTDLNIAHSEPFKTQLSRRVIWPTYIHITSVFKSKLPKQTQIALNSRLLVKCVQLQRDVFK